MSRMKNINTFIGVLFAFGVFDVLGDNNWKLDLQTYQQINDLDFHPRFIRDVDQSKTMLTTIYETIRDAIRNGISTIHLPSLDPLNIGNIQIPKDFIKGLESYINIKGNVSNLKLSGLSSFTVVNGDLSLFPPRFYTTFHIPILHFAGNSNLNGTIANWVPLNAHGPFSLTARNINISIDAPLKFVKGFYITLDDLKLKFNVNQFDTNLINSGGMMGGLVNSMLSGTLKSIFDNFVPGRFEYLSSLLKNIINNALLAMYHIS